MPILEAFCVSLILTYRARRERQRLEGKFGEREREKAMRRAEAAAAQSGTMRRAMTSTIAAVNRAGNSAAGLTGSVVEAAKSASSSAAGLVADLARTSFTEARGWVGSWRKLT